MTKAVAGRSGELLAEYERVGQRLPTVDALIAATADVHNLALASHDGVFERMRGDIVHYDPYEYKGSQRSP